MLRWPLHELVYSEASASLIGAMQPSIRRQKSYESPPVALLAAAIGLAMRSGRNPAVFRGRGRPDMAPVLLISQAGKRTPQCPAYMAPSSRPYSFFKQAEGNLDLKWISICANAICEEGAQSCGIPILTSTRLHSQSASTEESLNIMYLSCMAPSI